MRILLAIPTIDRDAKHFTEFYSRLKKAVDSSTHGVDILVLTRNQDAEIQKCYRDVEGVKVVLFENYEIKDRHNLGALVHKRNFAIQYAHQNQYDALWFVDADVGVQEDTLIRLAQSIDAGADIAVAPYRIREIERPAVAILNDESVVEALFDPQLIETNEIHFPILLGGFGCTLIHHETFNVRCIIRMVAARVNGVESGLNAEDTGFFLNAYEAGKNAYCISKHLVDHMDF